MILRILICQIIVSHNPQRLIDQYIVGTAFQIHKTLYTLTPEQSEDMPNFIIFH